MSHKTRETYGQTYVATIQITFLFRVYATRHSVIHCIELHMLM